MAVADSIIPGYPDAVETAFDSREVELLPPYCKHTQLFRDRVPGGNNAAEIERWSKLFGSSYSALHHYCWALMKTNRALFLARSTQTREFYLRGAVGEIDYVLERSSPSFVLLPELLTKKGENLLRLGRGPNAVVELQRAIETKPDYWPPYAALSDYYKDIGHRVLSREVLEKGISAAPDAQALRNRLAALDGSKETTKSTRSPDK
jgi:tetratricopeptide (TPR) repeat protein